MQIDKKIVLTFTSAVWTSEDCTLFYCAKRRKQLADILFGLLFAEHPHEQFPVWRWAVPKKEHKRLIRNKTRFLATTDLIQDSDNPVLEFSFILVTKNKEIPHHENLEQMTGKFNSSSKNQFELRWGEGYNIIY